MENRLEIGKEYSFAGYRWVPVRVNEEDQVAVMQSLGVTAGPWPGYSMPQFGNGGYCNQDISGEDISDYDENTRALMEQIKPVISGDAGLYLPSYDDIKDDSVWRDILMKAADNYRSFGASYYCAWIGTYSGDNYAWIEYSDGNTFYGNQGDSFVVPAAFNLDLSKVEVEGDEIKVKNTDNTQKNTVRMRVMAVRYGYTVVEAESESAAIELASSLSDDQFDWSNPDNIQVVDDNVDD